MFYNEVYTEYFTVSRFHAFDPVKWGFGILFVKQVHQGDIKLADGLWLIIQA